MPRIRQLRVERKGRGFQRQQGLRGLGLLLQTRHEGREGATAGIARNQAVVLTLPAPHAQQGRGRRLLIRRLHHAGEVREQRHHSASPGRHGFRLLRRFFGIELERALPRIRLAAAELRHSLRDRLRSRHGQIGLHKEGAVRGGLPQLRQRGERLRRRARQDQLFGVLAHSHHHGVTNQTSQQAEIAPGQGGPQLCFLILRVVSLLRRQNGETSSPEALVLQLLEVHLVIALGAILDHLHERGKQLIPQPLLITGGNAEGGVNRFQMC